MDTLGLCGLLAIVAVATVLIILGSKKPTVEIEADIKFNDNLTPQQELRKAIHSAINTVGFILYFIVSFLTGAWFITWIIFPIMGAVWGLAKAILDLKEAEEHET